MTIFRIKISASGRCLRLTDRATVARRAAPVVPTQDVTLRWLRPWERCPRATEVGAFAPLARIPRCCHPPRRGGGAARSACHLDAFGRWGFLGKNAQNLAGGIHQTKGVRFFAGMAPGYIMRPQLRGCDRLCGARRDRGFRLDHNASLEPNDCEQFGLLSASERQDAPTTHRAGLSRATPPARAGRRSCLLNASGGAYMVSRWAAEPTHGFRFLGVGPGSPNDAGWSFVFSAAHPTRNTPAPYLGPPGLPSTKKSPARRRASLERSPRYAVRS